MYQLSTWADAAKSECVVVRETCPENMEHLSFLSSVLPVVIAILVGLGLQLGYHVTYVRLSNSKGVQETLTQYGQRLVDLEQTQSANDKVGTLEESIQELDLKIQALRQEIGEKLTASSFSGSDVGTTKQDDSSESGKVFLQNRKAELMYIGLVAVVVIQLALAVCVVITCLLVKQLRTARPHTREQTDKQDNQQEVKCMNSEKHNDQASESIRTPMTSSGEDTSAFHSINSGEPTLPNGERAG